MSNTAHHPDGERSR